jgi:hypothetical protein
LNNVPREGFYEWLDDNPIFDRGFYKEGTEATHSNRVYGCDMAFGCQYAYEFRDYIHLRNSPTSSPNENLPTTPPDNDANVFIVRMDSPKRTCALEIFSNFILAATFHIEPLDKQGKSRKPREGFMEARR